MSRELVIYQRDVDGGYEAPDGWFSYSECDVDEYAAWKRFTAAELAAEWHANEVEAWRMTARRREFYDVDRAEVLEERESTLRRFAALPHFDEVA